MLEIKIRNEELFHAKMIKRGGRKRREGASRLVSLLSLIFFASVSFAFLILSAGRAHAAFSIEHECLEIHCFPDGKIFWKINITNTEKETIRISQISIKDLEGDVIANYDLKTEVAFGDNKVVVIEAMVPEATNYTYFYFTPCFTFYKLEDSKITILDERCYRIMNITVMPKPLVRCRKDNDCPQDMYCLERLCFRLKCNECQYIKEHKCIDYECCSNSECNVDEFCDQHNCIKLECREDEFIKEHRCEKLKCGILEKAENHECVKNRKLLIAIDITKTIAIIIIVLLFFTKIRFRGKTILQILIEKKRVAYYKRMEKKHLREAKVHSELIEYVKKRDEIQMHKKEAARHEKEAKRYRKEWEKILNLKRCEECGRNVDASLKKCPYCGEELK